MTDKVRQKQLNDVGFIERLDFCAKRAKNYANLSKVSGISKSTLSDYSRGNAEPSRIRLISIARAADVDISLLATGEGSPDKGGVDVSAYSGDVIDKHVVAQSVEAVKQYLDKTKEDMDPDAFANAVLAVCDLAPKYGDIDLQLIENIMKLKNSL